MKHTDPDPPRKRFDTDLHGDIFLMEGDVAVDVNKPLIKNEEIKDMGISKPRLLSLLNQVFSIGRLDRTREVRQTMRKIFGDPDESA